MVLEETMKTLVCSLFILFIIQKGNHPEGPISKLKPTKQSATVCENYIFFLIAK